MENTGEPYKIERVDANKLQDLETLYTAVYKVNLPIGFYLKKFDTSFTGVDYVGYVAYSQDGMPIAYYGVFPCLMQYKDEMILAAQSGETMTHPAYRYKGLFVILSRMTFALCRSLGIKLLFGFPNVNSYPGMVGKLGWLMTDTMDRFAIPIRTIPLARLFGRSGWAMPIYKRYIEWILQKYTRDQPGLTNDLLAQGYGGIYRDHRYWQYRAYSPTRVIRIGNSLAWIRVRSDLIIGDMHVEGPDFGKAIKILRKIAGRLGVRKISFLVSPGTSIHTLFKGSYSSIPSFPVLFQDLGSGIPLHDIKFTYSDIDIF